MMLIPYSTDAPIYHFPQMTVALIVVNAITFLITGMGFNSDGWLLTYGNGLHPLEWVAYNFLHFGPIHLIGNMFFLWAFGIVVEGKLGWWKFLLVYLGIGIVGGAMIQTAMLGYVANDWSACREPVHSERWNSERWTWGENSLFAQDGQLAKEMDEQDPRLVEFKEKFDKAARPGELDPDDANPNGEVPGHIRMMMRNAGAGGASLVIYGLMAIVLIWAPRNEVHCMWVGLRSGTFEIEYLYFCGLYIVIEVLSAIWSVRGFEVSSELGHAVGALLGFGVGILFVKQHWVDCENWDLFSVMQGKHSAATSVGDWQSAYVVGSSRKRGGDIVVSSDGGDEPTVVANPKKKKKKEKPKTKLVELESFDDGFDSTDDEETTVVSPFEEESESPFADSTVSKPAPRSPKGSRAGERARIRELIHAGEFQAASTEYLQHRASDSEFALPEDELRLLAEGLFKAKSFKDAASLLEDYVRRSHRDTNRERVKLALIYTKSLHRPMAAIKLIAKIDKTALPVEYQSTLAKVAREAQRMIAEGITDT